MAATCKFCKHLLSFLSLYSCITIIYGQYYINFQTQDQCKTGPTDTTHEYFDISQLRCSSCAQNTAYQTVSLDGEDSLLYIYFFLTAVKLISFSFILFSSVSPSMYVNQNELTVFGASEYIMCGILKEILHEFVIPGGLVWLVWQVQVQAEHTHWTTAIVHGQLKFHFLAVFNVLFNTFNFLYNFSCPCTMTVIQSIGNGLLSLSNEGLFRAQ